MGPDSAKTRSWGKNCKTFPQTRSGSPFNRRKQNMLTITTQSYYQKQDGKLLQQNKTCLFKVTQDQSTPLVN